MGLSEIIPSSLFEISADKCFRNARLLAASKTSRGPFVPIIDAKHKW